MKRSVLFAVLLAGMVSGCSLDRTCDIWQYFDDNGECRPKDVNNCFRGLIYDPNDSTMQGTVKGRACILSEGAESMACVINTDTSDSGYGDTACVAESCDILHYLDNGVCKLKDKYHCGVGYRLEDMKTCDLTSGASAMDCVIVTDQGDANYMNASCVAVSCDLVHYLDDGECLAKDSSHCGEGSDPAMLIDCGEGALGCMNNQCVCGMNAFLSDGVCKLKDVEHCGYSGEVNCNASISAGVGAMACVNSDCVVSSCAGENYVLSESGGKAACVCREDSFRTAAGECVQKSAEYCGITGEINCNANKPLGAMAMACVSDACVIQGCEEGNYEQRGTGADAVCKCNVISYYDESNHCVSKSDEMCGFGNNMEDMKPCNANEKCDLDPKSGRAGTCVLKSIDERCRDSMCPSGDCREITIDGVPYLCDEDYCRENDPSLYSYKEFEDAEAECTYSGEVYFKYSLDKKSDTEYVTTSVVCSISQTIALVNAAMSTTILTDEEISSMSILCKESNPYAICTSAKTASFTSTHKLQLVKIGFWYTITHMENETNNFLNDLNIDITDLLESEEIQKICDSQSLCGDSELLYYCLADVTMSMLSMVSVTINLMEKCDNTTNPIMKMACQGAMNSFFKSISIEAILDKLGLQACTGEPGEDISKCVTYCSDDQNTGTPYENFTKNHCYTFTSEMIPYIISNKDKIMQELFKVNPRYPVN